MKNNTINIAICDDEHRTLLGMNEIIDKYMNHINVEYNIRIFDNPCSLLAAEGFIDVLFLDVEMPEMDGFTVAEKIREKNKEIKIVFVTSHSELVQKAFKVKAFRYLYKGCNDDEIKEVMDDAIKEMKECNVIVSEFKDTKSYIRIKNIYWIESLGDSTAVHFKEDEIITSKTLRFWKQEFKDCLFQCHKSYVINLYHIKSITNDGIELENGAVISVSSRNRGALRKEFHEFIKRNAKYM